ncbi:hypothetical protein KAFR_0A01520 [Kazachstania africana CBS 2517]|uniref:Arrestin C-terminal-like domain-containing protein n=1 Tax=Kazachstania africana (strain ATCC 22294 / BCRC 22015 / CBS 2517 / CECT 1963 / NBRC 1671 / NRRL Y-8276) TaxID=1071382 RepID=H2AMJ0_KAZAF|nr:hypothetical protein KAFR_0A01520 [Kazachstania africana CBS 2517]CCF55590.1 hypothetical protein KAFR_0A01520 [Kazachstania africana CBS 2517]
MKQTQFNTLSAPLFPPEKDITISIDDEPLNHSNTVQVYVKLVEPVIFLQGFKPSSRSHTNPVDDTGKPPALLRGSLIIRVLKPIKLKSITLTFKGVSKTDWPEGIPPKKNEFVESKDIINHVWPFYSSSINPTNSGASIYKPAYSTDITSPLNLSPRTSLEQQQPIPPRKVRTRALSATSITSNSSSKARSLSPLNLFRRVASFGHDDNFNTNNNNEDAYSTISSTSNTKHTLISDLLSSTFSNDATPSVKSLTSSNNTTNNILNLNNNTDILTFQPGDYIYPFEQPLSQTLPESIRADFGSVEYSLMVTVEKFTHFKHTINSKLPVRIIRTQSDTSVEESEPIVISRDWEKLLYYNIIIASKDIILDAFLPIHFKFAPLDKLVLHRIRVYITETMEYYCRSQKVHRVEPTKKVLLAEHCGPRLKNLPPNLIHSTKAKYMGNLLKENSDDDDDNGIISNKEFEFKVFVPNKFKEQNMTQRLHPDTAHDNIKANHWIKICLRLSRNIDGKRKHYEISIDSPIHVLHKLCSHANTLLPSYYSHLSVNQGTVPSSEGSTPQELYHNSNIFFPKEVILSPLLSPEVQPLDINITCNRQIARTNTIHDKTNKNAKFSKNTSQENQIDILSSPSLKPNLFYPERVPKELTSPQAIPLSPINSPSLRPISLILDDNGQLDNDFSSPPPPDFDQPPEEPPSYTDSIRAGGTNSSLDLLKNNTAKKFQRIKLNKSLDKVFMNNRRKSSSVHRSELTSLNLDAELENSFNGDDESFDIGSNFSFSGSNSISQNVPTSILLKNQSPILRPMTSNNTTDLSPTTTIGGDNAIGTLNSNNATVATSNRSSVYIDMANSSQINPILLQPLLERNTTNTTSMEESMLQSTMEPLDSSVDITSLYNHNSFRFAELEQDSYSNNDDNDICRAASNDVSTSLNNSNNTDKSLVNLSELTDSNDKLVNEAESKLLKRINKACT